MKKLLAIFLVIIFYHTNAQQTKAPTLKSILLAQLHSTHDVKEWFVPANIAVAGLTAEQAKWTDGSGNHSVGQLANHLIFWNLQQLLKFKNLPQPAFSGNNDETFNAFDSKNWNATVQRLDSVLTAIEKAVAPIQIKCAFRVAGQIQAKRLKAIMAKCRKERKISRRTSISPID